MAPDRRSVVGSAAFLAVSRLVVSAISYVATALVARTLSVDDWGTYSLVLSLTTVLDFVFDLQVGRLVLKQLAATDGTESHALGSFLALRLTLGALSYGVGVAFVAAGPFPNRVVPAVAVGGTALVFAAGWNAINLFFQARLWFRSVAMVLVAARVVFVGTCVALAAGGTKSPLVFLGATVLTEAIPLPVLWFVARRHVRMRLAVEPARWVTWIKESAPIAVGAAIGAVYFRIDAVLLSALDSLRAVGLYSVGYKFADVLAYVGAALMAPAYTLLVRAWPDHTSAFAQTWRGAFTLLTVTAAGLATAFAVFAGPTISLLFGARYAPATDAARLIVVGQALRFPTMLLVGTLIAVGRNRPYVVASVVGFVVNVAGNLVVIPHWSYTGAAAMTVATEAGVLVLLGRAVLALPELAVPVGVLARTAVASAALAGVGVAVDAVAPWPFAAMAGVVAFAAVLHTIGIDGPGGLRVLPHLLQDHVPTEPARPRA